MSDIPRIIGLNGVARAGKDTLAKILVDLYGYHTASFSDALNNALIALNPVVRVDGLPLATGTVIRYADLIEERGYEAAKEIPEVRRLLQAMGTEVGRAMFGEDVWVEALFKGIGPRDFVTITNVRFPNEYAAVKERGGEVWLVTRPGFAPANDHISDKALNGYEFDATFHNDGTVVDLANKVVDTLYQYSIAKKERARA